MEETDEILVNTKEEEDTKEIMSDLFINTELEVTKDILRFDENGILLKVEKIQKVKQR